MTLDRVENAGIFQLHRGFLVLVYALLTRGLMTDRRFAGEDVVSEGWLLS